MADEYKPSTQQTQDAVQLDNLTSLQQPTESDQAGSAESTDVRADAVVSQTSTSTPEGPSFYLPNTDLTNSPPAESGGTTTTGLQKEEDALLVQNEFQSTEELDNSLNVNGVSFAETLEDQDASDVTSYTSVENLSAAMNGNTSTGTTNSGPTNTSALGGEDEQESLLIVNESEAETQSLASVTETERIELTTIPQVTNVVESETAVSEVSAQPLTDAVEESESVPTLSSDSEVTSDGGGATTVAGTNDAPVATDGSAETEENAVLNSRVPVATDVDGTVESYTLVADVSAGNLTFNADGTYSFDPQNAFDDLADGDTRDVSFTYYASDNDGAVSGIKTVTITITGTNDAAVIGGDTSGTVVEDATTTTATGTLTSTDVDNTANAFQAVESATASANGYGTYTVTAGGVWTYTLDNTNATVNALNENSPALTDTFTVKSADGTTQVVTVTITGTNDAPVAVADTQSTGENAVLNSSVPVATDVDGTVASYTLVDDVTEGKLTFNANGTYSFDPESAFDDLAAGDTREVTFTYYASDDLGAVSSTQTVTITVTGTNDGPIIGTSAADVLVGTSGADIIDGLAGGDTMTGGAGADTFVVSSGFAISWQLNNASITGYDIITDFASNEDSIKLPVNVKFVNDDIAVNGVDSNLRVGSNLHIRSHTVSKGEITFFTTDDGAGPAVLLDQHSKVATAVEYLSLNNLGGAGATVFFSTSISAGDSLFKHYIYQQTTDENPVTYSGNNEKALLSSATLVEIHAVSFTPVVDTQYINPIALDLNRDGVTYVDRSQGITYDYANDGNVVSTAWVNSSDGLLGVKLDNGNVNIVFSTQPGETDLEGLAKVYDTNKDAVFDSNDEQFYKFGVWQDANKDGVVQAGEFISLGEAGITSLSLVSSGERVVTADGDVIVYGQSTFTTKDGLTHILEDAGFATTVNTQMISGQISSTEPSLIAKVSTATAGKESLLAYSVVAAIDNSDAKVGDVISLIINDGAITITHILTAEDVANKRYEFRMSDNTIVTDVTNVVGVHLGVMDAAITSYANPVSIPYALLAPAEYVAPTALTEAVADPEFVGQSLLVSVVVSEVLVDSGSETKALETKDLVVSNGTLSSVTVVDNTHYTLEVVTDAQTPLSAVSVEVVLNLESAAVSQSLANETLLALPAEPATAVPAPDTSEFMLLELGGVTYMIDTSESKAAEVIATEDFALSSSLTVPLVAGSWTEVVAGEEVVDKTEGPLDLAAPVNPLTDTSAPPVISNEVLDTPRLTDNGSWTP